MEPSAQHCIYNCTFVLKKRLMADLPLGKVLFVWLNCLDVYDTVFSQTSTPTSSNENSPVSPPDEPVQGDCTGQLEEEEEPAFPHTDLAKLDDMINRYVECMCPAHCHCHGSVQDHGVLQDCVL